MLDPQLKWLLLEGALPLFGAGLLFVIWGGMVLIAKGTSSVTYAWREAIDSIGWIYGALIIAIQSGFRSFSAAPQAPGLGWGCIIGAIICTLLLLAAMSERGQNPGWQPPPSLKISAGLLVLAILYAGYSAQALSLSVAKPNQAPTVNAGSVEKSTAIAEAAPFATGEKK